MRQSLLLSACLVIGATSALADDKDRKDDKTKSEPTAVAVELQVTRKLDQKQFQYLNAADSTRLVFVLRYPGKQLLGVDQSSRVTSLKDDKGNSMADEKSSFPPNFSTYPQVALDRSALLVTVGAYNRAPGKGATKLLSRATWS